MPDGIRTFWCEDTGLVQVRLSVASPNDQVCPGQADGWRRYEPSHHAAAVVFECAEGRKDENGYLVEVPAGEFDRNPLWPTSCAYCDAVVADEWDRCVFQDAWYKAPGIGQWVQRDLPVGAMYDAWWYPTAWRGDDGITLEVMVPNGHGGATPWCVDSVARNCDRRGEQLVTKMHRCWCRHGDPRTEPVTVDKQCDTCAAGAGSIGIGDPAGGYDWHGYLRDGFLVVA